MSAELVSTFIPDLMITDYLNVRVNAHQSEASETPVSRFLTLIVIQH